MAISDIIKQRRTELGLTLKEIADQVGVSEATVQRYESGNIKNLRHDKIAKLAKALQVSPEYLMGWETDFLAEKKDSQAVAKESLRQMMIERGIIPADRDLTDAELNKLMAIAKAFFQSDKE